MQMSQIFTLEEYSFLFNFFISTLLFQYFFRILNKDKFILLLYMFFTVFLCSHFFHSYQKNIALFVLHLFPLMLIIYQTKNFFLGAVYIIIQNGSLGLSWFISFDIFFQFRDFYVRYISFLIILNTLLVFLITYFIILLEKKTNFLKVITNSSKNYNLLSTLLLLGFAINYMIRFMILDNSFIERLYSSNVLFIYIATSLLICYNILIKRQQDEHLAFLAQTAKQEKKKLRALEEFHHDYHGLLLSLTRYIELEENQKALELIKKETNYIHASIPNDEFRYLRQIELAPVQGIVMNYLRLFKENNIDYLLEVQGIVDTLPIELFDFVRCLNILLENAAEEVHSKVIIHIKSVNDSIYIHISNDFATEKKVDLKEITKRGYSTKGNRGKGLYIFSKLLSRYPNSHFHISAEKNTFCVDLVVR